MFVTEVDTVKYEADMLAFWTAGRSFGEPHRFNLSGTPCESILDGQIAAFPRRVADLFPGAKEILEKLGTQSCPRHSHSGRGYDRNWSYRRPRSART